MQFRNQTPKLHKNLLHITFFHEKIMQFRNFSPKLHKNQNIGKTILQPMNQVRECKLNCVRLQ